MRTIIHTLQNCSDLATFSTSELAELAAISKMVDFAKGHDVFSVEHGDQYLFIVAEGLLSLRLNREHVSKDFHEKDLFGEIVLFSDRGRMGTIRCLEKSTLLAIDKKGILEENKKVSTSTRFKFLQKMGEKMAGYFYQENKKDAEDLIQEKASENLAFIPSIESDYWNDMVITTAAFMNLNGGTILCGIDQNGHFDIHARYRDEIDEFEQKFRLILEQHLGDNLSEIHFDFKPVGDHKVVRIDVQAAAFPVFYQEKINGKSSAERFFIRTGHNNHALRMATEMVAYIQRRFKLKLG